MWIHNVYWISYLQWHFLQDYAIQLNKNYIIQFKLPSPCKDICWDNVDSFYQCTRPIYVIKVHSPQVCHHWKYDARLDLIEPDFRFRLSWLIFYIALWSNMLKIFTFCDMISYYFFIWSFYLNINNNI